MISIVMAYAVCWLPIHILTVYGDTNPQIFDSKIVHVTWLFFHWIAMSNSAVNPTIYLSTQTIYRNALMNVLEKHRARDDEGMALFSSLRHRIRNSLSTTITLLPSRLSSPALSLGKDSKTSSPVLNLDRGSKTRNAPLSLV